MVKIFRAFKFSSCHTTDKNILTANFSQTTVIHSVHKKITSQNCLYTWWLQNLGYTYCIYTYEKKIINSMTSLEISYDTAQMQCYTILACGSKPTHVVAVVLWINYTCVVTYLLTWVCKVNVPMYLLKHHSLRISYCTSWMCVVSIILNYHASC